MEEPVEIFIDGKNVIVAKYTPVCILCGSDKHLTRYRDKNICNDCIGKKENFDVRPMFINGVFIKEKIIIIAPKNEYSII